MRISRPSSLRCGLLEILPLLALVNLFQHFIFIADAMTFKQGHNELSLWNEEDGQYYDAIEFDDFNSMQLPIRSLVGLIPLYATMVLEPHVLNRFPGFKKRVEWFLDNRPEVSARNMANMKGIDLAFCFTYPTNSAIIAGGKEQRRLLALASKERLTKILEKMLDEDEFLSEYGVRSCVSRIQIAIGYANLGIFQSV